MKSPVVVIMAKKPQPGLSKTRLCPPYTPNQAALLAEALLKDTIDFVNTLPGIQPAVAITPPDEISYFQNLCPNHFWLLPVVGANIGECLNSTINTILEKGNPKVIAINADGPDLPASYLLQSLADLDTHDLVIGPTTDGGYYMIGQKLPAPQLFDGIKWSTDLVLQQTLENAKISGLTYAIQPRWQDVDTGADVERLELHLKDMPKGRLIHTRKAMASGIITKTGE